MDKILALYVNQTLAELVRMRLFADGFPTDRIDVVSWDQNGRFIDDPAMSRQDNLIAHFATLLPEDHEVPQLTRLVKALREGRAGVIVHPRGTVEITHAREILESHKPEAEFWRVAPPQAQGGLLGEHAAGGR
jgi:hypothetical protein